MEYIVSSFLDARHRHTYHLFSFFLVLLCFCILLLIPENRIIGIKLLVIHIKHGRCVFGYSFSHHNITFVIRQQVIFICSCCVFRRFKNVKVNINFIHGRKSAVDRTFTKQYRVYFINRIQNINNIYQNYYLNF